MKIIYIIPIILLVSRIVFGQSTLEKIESLNLQKDNGAILKYYSIGFNERAEELEKLLENSLTYFEKNLGVKETFFIAVLDSIDWVKITNIPYGLPFVSGPPYVVCFPASNNNILSQIIKKSISGYGLTSVYHKTNEELVQLFISMIGFHELGHIYAKKYGLIFPNKWTFEFVATYIAYLYLEDNFPIEADIWRRISEILIIKIIPNHTLLSEFEKLYFRVGIENYAWYQVAFLLKVVDVKDKLGINFLKKLSNVELVSSNEDFSLGILENIEPGFIAWAKKYKLLLDY